MVDRSKVKRRLTTFDCAPTLTDTQVLDFVKKGYLLMESVVPDEINKRVKAKLDERELVIGVSKPHDLLQEDWFVESVLHNTQAVGAVRSLLGADYAEVGGGGRMNSLALFAGKGPSPVGQWHVDGAYRFGPEMNHLKWFYYPIDSPEESGPTEFVIGSHHVRNQVRFMAHYQGIRGIWKSSAPAGSIVIAAYPIWHRRARCTWDKVRYMLTTSLWRTTPPKRDWIVEPDFDFETTNYSLSAPRFGEQHASAHKNARMFYWMCGKIEEFSTLPCPTWPQAVPGNADDPYASNSAQHGR